MKVLEFGCVVVDKDGPRHAHYAENLLNRASYSNEILASEFDLMSIPTDFVVTNYTAVLNLGGMVLRHISPNVQFKVPRWRRDQSGYQQRLMEFFDGLTQLQR